MWKDHSADYIRQTKSSAVSVVVATFISALFLSLLCSLAYNFWTYETEQIVIEEGDWQGRISGNLKENDLIQLKNFANVEKVMVNENLSDGESLTVDIYFHNMRTAYEDMYLIAGQLHLDPETVSCHDLLLSRYLIHDPQDETPPLLLIAGRPILITLPLTVIFVSLMITVSSLAPSEFWSEAPIGIITVFMLAVIGFVALAYVIGGRRIMQCNLTEALRSP